MTAPPRGPQHRTVPERTAFGRRGFLTFLVAAPVLTMATTVAVDSATGTPAAAEPLLPDLPNVTDITDIGDVLVLAAAPTHHLLVLEVTEAGRVRFEFPRTEVGQGITTAIAMLIAEELDVPLDQVDMPYSDARPELVFNQLTGASCTVRVLYDPVRELAAAVRARLLAAAAREWDLPVERLTTDAGRVLSPGGIGATFGTLSGLAAAPDLVGATSTPKPESEHRLVGTRTHRIDGHEIVTGRRRYTLDLDVPGAVPTMVRRAPTLNGSVSSVHNEDAVRAMPGVLDLAVVPTGVAVAAETFGQALNATAALEVSWSGGTVDDLSDEDITARLRAARPPMTPAAPGTRTVEAEFDFAFVSHAAMETNSAIADVRADRAEIWSGLKSPILAQQLIAGELGLPVDRVTVHVEPAGGSFGRRLFADGALEAAQISQALGRPVKLMWSRVDDMRHGRMRPAIHHHLRATIGGGEVLTFDQRTASVETDFSMGFGEILTATAPKLPFGNLTFAEAVWVLTQSVPYDLGAVSQLLTEIPLEMPTGSWRAVYSPTTRGAQEILLDELAAELGQDPVEFRLALLKDERWRAVLEKAAELGDWGRSMPEGHAQGIGFHEEHRSANACLVEIDARDPSAARVVKAVMVVDVGRVLNPPGLEAQMLGGLTDAIATTLRAGLHIRDGLPLEGSYSQFHFARQADSPTDVTIHIMAPTGPPGGAGELGLAAPVGAIANAYARATGIAPRSFPITFPVDFEPFPR